jgi:hypothetical protein
VALTIHTKVFLEFQTADGEPLFSRSQLVNLNMDDEWTGGGQVSFDVTVRGTSRSFRVPITLPLPERVPVEGDHMQMRFRPDPIKLEPSRVTVAAGQLQQVYDI